MIETRFAALQERAAGRRGALTPSDVGTNAPAAKRTWRCRFCATVLLVRSGLVRCSQCLQETVVAEASA